MTTCIKLILKKLQLHLIEAVRITKCMLILVVTPESNCSPFTFLSKYTNRESLSAMLIELLYLLMVYAYIFV